MSRLSEKQDVQNELIHHLLGIGWRYLPPGDVDALRGGDRTQPFLPAVLRDKLISLNASTELGTSPGLVTAQNVNDAIARLRRLPATLEGNEQFIRALRGGWTVYHDEEKRERNLALVDFDDLRANDFSFTQELAFEDLGSRRLDLVLYVNGLPLVIVENKSPRLPEPELEAFDQVQHLYTAEIPELLKYTLFWAACDARIHYGATWNDDLKAFYRWKAQGQDHGLERLGKTLFDRVHLLDMARDSVIFFRADDQTHKFVLRPHQMRAVNRLVERVAASFPSPGARGEGACTGLIWHTQGSGKTLTMIVAASKLRRLPELENPTILIVVDRRELESQMVQNLEAFGFPLVERARSRPHLRELLRSDYRGLIVTLIHKFDRMPKNLNMRPNVVVMIDEAHRSQEGDLGVYMRAALPNAIHFGFTGTPIDANRDGSPGKVGRGTFELFGKPDPDGYLDKYGIDESIVDKATVRLYYTLAPSELHIDRETLEREFYRVVEDAGVASFEQLNRLLDKAEHLKSVLKAPARVDAIARHVAEHLKSNVDPRGFKAFLVAVDREACALYKQALDKYLPAHYSRAVYTDDPKRDTPLMRTYYLSDDGEKRTRRAFRDPDSDLKLLIVTEKLLTGYDAPVLYALYLDKPLKDHTLLQAIARVNRPYPGKDSGLVVDYIGILENLQRALAFDAQAVSKALIDLDELKSEFAALIERIERDLASIGLDQPLGRVERIIERFFEPEGREAFVRDYKALQAAYEILSPDPFLRDYIDRYALITDVYLTVYNYFNPESEKRRLQYDLLQKTDRLIREQVKVTYLAAPLPEYPISRDIARIVEADQVSDQVKIINLYRSVIAHVEANKAEQPYLVSIGEEVEAIIERLHQRQISAQLALEQIKTQAEQAAQAHEEQAQSDLSGEAFAVYWVIKGHNVPQAQAQAEAVAGVLAAFPDWPYNDRVEQHARIELYKLLMDAVGKDAARLKAVVDDVLKMHRMANP